MFRRTWLIHVATKGGRRPKCRRNLRIFGRIRRGIDETVGRLAEQWLCRIGRHASPGSEAFRSAQVRKCFSNTQGTQEQYSQSNHHHVHHCHQFFLSHILRSQTFIISPNSTDSHNNNDNNSIHKETMTPRPLEITNDGVGAGVDYSHQEAVATMLTSQHLCEQDDHCMSPSDLKELRKLEGNNFCIDCGTASPDWASITLGIFMCLDCSGKHRYVTYCTFEQRKNLSPLSSSHTTSFLSLTVPWEHMSQKLDQCAWMHGPTKLFS